MIELTLAREALKASELKPREIAAKIGVCAETVRLAFRGGGRCNDQLAYAISRQIERTGVECPARWFWMHGDQPTTGSRGRKCGHSTKRLNKEAA